MAPANEVRDWLHVQAATNLLVLAVEHASPARLILNEWAGEGICVKDVLQHLSEQLGLSSKPQFMVNKLRPLLLRHGMAPKTWSDHLLLARQKE